MQGWRNTMEDSEICEVDLGDGVHFFGVYDGHGGKQSLFFTIHKSLRYLRPQHNH